MKLLIGATEWTPLLNQRKNSSHTDLTLEEYKWTGYDSFIKPVVYFFEKQQQKSPAEAPSKGWTPVSAVQVANTFWGALPGLEVEGSMAGPSGVEPKLLKLSVVHQGRMK